MKRVLVIGDVIADVYTECYFKKMCPDAPDVPAMVKLCSETIPGGAANVALNVSSLFPDSIVDLIGFVGSSLANEIKRRSHNRVCMWHSRIVDSGLELTKERVILRGSWADKTIARIDNFESIPEMLLAGFDGCIDDYFRVTDPDLIIFSDYAGGMIRFWDAIPARYRDRILVDTKQIELNVFDGCLAIKLNSDEYRRVLSIDHSPERWCKALVTTHGADGATLRVMGRSQLAGREVSVTHTLRVSGHEVCVVDVCGCGDTFIAGMAASLLGNDDMFSAVQFGNAAAASVVAQPRVAVADLGRTLELLGRSNEVSAGCSDRDHRDPQEGSY